MTGVAPASARNSRLRCGWSANPQSLRGRGEAGATAQERERAAEPEDPRDGLGRHADVLAEAGGEMAPAAAELPRERADPHAAGGGLEPRPGPRGVGRRGRRTRQPRHEQGVEQGEARLPPGRGVEPLLELGGLAAEHVAEVDGEGAAERVERHPEQGARRERRQVDLHPAGARLEARDRRPVVDGRHEEPKRLPSTSNGPPRLRIRLTRSCGSSVRRTGAAARSS